MATNTVILQILGVIVGVVVPCALLAGLVVGIVLLIKHFTKKGHATAKRWYAVILFTVVVVFASWILNFGWFRVFLTWIPIPLAHTVAFMCINLKAASKASAHKPFKKLIALSCLSFLLTYLSFPDGGDVGGAYVFFGLIRNDFVVYIATYITLFALIFNIVIFVFEIRELLKPKKESPDIQ